MVENCVLCRCSERDELIFGTVHVKDKMMVHTNCLYLSSNLVQRGDKRLGILNFLKEDIEAEVKRCRTLVCYYCRRPGANIGCCKSGCRRTFHTKCGVDNLAQNQFSDTYRSYCHQHVLMHRRRPALVKEEECVICTEALIGEGERFSVVTCIYAPCCRNGWFHRKCLQRYANSAGYFFKCPLCNNLEVFRKVVLMGISVLNQDATWETEPNAFADQFRRDIICTAVKCVAVSGRDDTSAMLLYCNNCGANPSHFLCTVQNHETYVCHICAAVLPNPVPHVDSDSDDGDSIDETDFQAAVAELAANEQGDLIHQKLSGSLWDDSDSSDNDDDAVFKRAVDTKPEETNSDDKPSTSAAARALARTRSSPAAAGSSLGSRATRGSRTTVESPRGSQSTALILRAAAAGSSLGSRAIAAPTRGSRTTVESPRGSQATTQVSRAAAAGSSLGSRATAAPTRGSRTTVESPRGSQATTQVSRAAAVGSSLGSRATAAPTRGSRTTVESPRGSQATTQVSRAAAAGSSLGSRATAAPTRRSRTPVVSPRGSRPSRTSVAVPPRATTTTAGSSSTPTLDNQENTEPSTSSVRRSLRPRRTMPARIAEHKESDSEDSDGATVAKRRRLSPTATEPSTDRRLLRSITPEPSTQARRTLRRRTLANVHPTYTNMDVSCVANRTRNRLPNHLATRKD
ncbi:uncharacterized protein LOC122623545 [Drosophila teissieri]|uniref:uncharacterized protein LOC122623545 n=1 Tax=Drosophila teissieri TaxID=7243 RepID=UPI001CB9F2FB|nr:uncharacterized protein LOC122623545 [Drosophila teissieri]